MRAKIVLFEVQSQYRDLSLPRGARAGIAVMACCLTCDQDRLAFDIFLGWTYNSTKHCFQPVTENLKEHHKDLEN